MKFFNRIKKRKPQKGEEWALKGDGSPWPKGMEGLVEILDVKDDWVRYRIGSAFPDERMEIKYFLQCYSFRNE